MGLLLTLYSIPERIDIFSILSTFKIKLKFTQISLTGLNNVAR